MTARKWLDGEYRIPAVETEPQTAWAVLWAGLERAWAIDRATTLGVLVVFVIGGAVAFCDGLTAIARLFGGAA